MSRDQVAVLRSLEGRRISMSLSDGSRIDDCQLVSGGRSGARTLWVFTNGTEITLEFRVRKAGVSVIAGGKTIIDWRGNFNRLSLPDGWKVKNANALFLAAWGSRYHFSKILLIPVSGQGKKLR